MSNICMDNYCQYHDAGYKHAEFYCELPGHNILLSNIMRA